MNNTKFVIDLPCSPEKIFNIATNYERFKDYFPAQIKEIKILEIKNKKTITEETLQFLTIMKTSITQTVEHNIIDANKIENKVLSGPLEGTILTVVFEKIENGTKVIVEYDLKLKTKYFILEPIIRKRYRNVLTALLYKMNTMALQA